MAIDPAVLRRQRAVLAGEPEPHVPKLRKPRSGGPKRTDKTCPRCKERPLFATNRVGVCSECWNSISPRARAEVLGLELKPKQRKASAATVEKARTRLAAHGIHTEAA